MDSCFPKLVICCVVAAVSACSPKFDWRDYRSDKAPYAVLFPGKPATHTRAVNLDGQNADMTMAAVDIDGTLFAVGSAEMPDPDKAQLAVQAMKKAMVRNIGAAGALEATRDGAFTVEAKGSRNGQPMTLNGRFMARGTRVYQVVVVGPANGVGKEDVSTFLQSFTPN